MNAERDTLNESQFNALISLLDDEDPEVSEHVWSTLMKMGHEGVERLEAAWETQDDPEMQKRLEEVIHKLHLKEVSSELLDWRKRGGRDLLKGWFALSRFQFPELDYRRYRNEINRLVNKTWLELNDRMDPEQKLRVLNHMLFRMEGYGPNQAKPQHPNNNFLNYVVEQQRGNAISLSMIYLLICQQLDMPVSGVILPGYFILMYKDEKAEFYIDVFNGGKTFNRARLEGYLKQVNVEEKPSYFKPTSNIYIILNLIQHLVVDFKNADRMDKVAELEELLDGIEIRFGG